MVDWQERGLRRDGILFLFGLAGMIVVIIAGSPHQAASGNTSIHEFLFGCSSGILLSVIFKFTDKQTLISALLLGIGFALWAVIFGMNM